MKPGDLVSHYRIVGKLGEGGMGEVFVAHDETLKRKVALKSIRAKHRLDAQARTRFMREARLLSQLDNPHICRIFDYIEGADHDLLVLELIEGRPLYDAAAGLSFGAKLAIAEQIAEALVAAHAEAIVHRDLKPGNIMLARSGGVKVLDFGLARGVDGAVRAADEATADDEAHPESAQGSIGEDSISAFRSEAGFISGTLQYMSPEQARGDEAGPASDMFSFAIVLQELFTGTPARKLRGWEGLAHAAEGETLPVRGLPRDLSALIERLLERAPTRRPTAVEALERLKWIRAKPRRRLRRALAAVVVLFGLLGGLKYTLDVRAERATSEAHRRRVEDNFAFMLGDLYDKLKPVGRTAILSDVGERALDYYAAIPPERLLPDQVANSALAWIHIGRVRRDQGSLPTSLEAFEKALALLDSRVAGTVPPAREARLRRAAWNEIGGVRQDQGELDSAEQAFRTLEDLARGETTEWDDALPARAWVGHALTKRGEIAFARGDLTQAADHFARARADLSALNNADTEGRFLLGQVEFWIGYVHKERGDLEGAEGPWLSYRDIARGLAAQDPANVRWKIEVAYAHTNLGALLQARGRVEAAETEFREVVESWRALTVHDPSNSEWQRELADALSWLSTSVLSRWRVANALEPLEEERRIRELLSARDPTNMLWVRMRTICENNLGNTLEALGRFEEARGHYANAVVLSQSLVAAEPTNTDWQLDLAVQEMRLGRLLIEERALDAAREHLEGSRRIFEDLCARQDPKPDWVLGSATGTLDRAALQLEQGADAAASESLDRAETSLRGILTVTVDPELARRAHGLSALLHLLRGCIHERAGESDRARSEWRAAIDELEPIVWVVFQTQPVRTYSKATRLLNGEAAALALFDRFRDLGYVFVATGR